MKSNCGKLLKLYVLVLLCLPELSAQKVNVYVSPHPDDWQLFMNPNAFYSVAQSSQKVIFLHTTSGDAGTFDTLYYTTREEGSLRAIRFMVSSTSDTNGTNTNRVTVNINGHNICKHIYGNAVIYFLRLPDGQGDGSGFPKNNNQSLYKFFNGTISSIRAIDNSTTYISKIDLETTIKQIITLESANKDSIIIHCADTNITNNPGDHSDHYTSSEILQEVGNTLDKAKIYFYQDYVTNSKAQNLSSNEFLIEASTWGVTNSILTDFNFPTSFDETHNGWIGKQYFRVVDLNNLNIDTVPPTPPTNLLATPISSTSINLTWLSSTDNKSVAGYSIYRNNVFIASSSGLTYSDIGLSPSTQYIYAVKAYDAAGNQSLFSQSITGMTLQSTDTVAPSMPTNLTVSSVSYNLVNLVWTASFDNVGVTGYSIYRNNNLINTTTELTYKDSSLIQGTTYTYTIKAFDASGNQSQYSSPVNATTLVDTEAPSIPSNLSAIATSNVSINLTWGASNDNVGVAGYTIYRNNVQVTNTTLLNFSDSSLQPGTTYSYAVRAFDAKGNQSALSNTISAATPVLSTNLALNKPATASSYEYQNASYAVNGNYDKWDFWSAVPYSQWWRVDLQNEYFLNKVVLVTYYDGSRYYRYDIQVSLDGSTWSPLVDFNSNTIPAAASGNSFDISSVKARYIRVNMNYNSANSGVHIIEFEAYGTPASVTQVDDVPPSRVNNLTANINSNNYIELNWAASTDNIGVSGYSIYRNNIHLSNTTSLNYTDNTTLPGNTYTYYVVSYDNAGNTGEASLSVSATIPNQTSENLALNKPATASSYEYQGASYAVNGNSDRWDFWSASPYPQWWRVDLQNEYVLNKIVVKTYYDGSRYYRYDIQVSLDGINWTTVIDYSSNTIPATASGNTFNLNNVHARYVRVNMKYNSVNSAVHLIEFEAYGTTNVSANTSFSLQSQAFTTLNLEEASTANLLSSPSTIEITGVNENSIVSIYPNPVISNDGLTVLYNSTSNESVAVSIYNLSGSKIFENKFEVVSGINEVRLNFPNDLKLLGIYLVEVTSKTSKSIKRVVFE